MGSSEAVKIAATGGLSLAYDEMVTKPRKQAEEAANKQLAAQAKAEQDFNDQKARNQAALDRDNAKNAIKANSITNSGRKGTILTGPSGITTPVQTGSKTLLGT